ncbi:hypothetical protein [Streptomyces sp. NPDC088254]|uniref:hypothetical protein n=1 Tax=Streptomyces sp. NPDC088254 TaxID=3365847 RepID=UPI0037F1B2DD
MNGINGTPAVLAGAVYTFACVRSGKALDDANTTNEGSPIIQWNLRHRGPAGLERDHGRLSTRHHC